MKSYKLLSLYSPGARAFFFLMDKSVIIISVCIEFSGKMWYTYNVN